MLYIYFFLFITALISGSALLFFNSRNKLYLKLLLAFSGSYLFALSVLNLIPEIYVSHKITDKIGVYILIGFFIQVVLELLTRGAEHGHLHAHLSHEHHEHKHNLFPLGMMIGLCIHSFLEGMPLADSFHTTIQKELTLGIIIHNIPISIVLMSMFLDSGIKRGRALLLLSVFALMNPLGAFFSNTIDSNLVLNLAGYSDKIMAIVVGIFLHVSTSILFEAEENHRFNFFKSIIVLLGAIAAFFVSSLY